MFEYIQNILIYGMIILMSEKLKEFIAKPNYNTQLRIQY